MSSKEPLIILGVDPGTRCAGYALLRLTGSTFTALEYGAIRPDADSLITQRYAELFREITRLIEEFSPHVVAVESQFVQKNIESAMKLGRAQAMVLLAATLKDLSVFSYYPTLIKQAVAGNGHASKEQVRERVKMLLKLSKAPSHDAADAIAIAMCHGHRAYGPTPPLRI